MSALRSGDTRIDRRLSGRVVALTLALMLASVLPIHAQDPPDLLAPADPAELASFLADLDLLARILDHQLANPEAGPSLRQSIEALSPDEQLGLFNVIPRERLAAAVDAMATGLGGERRGPSITERVIVGTNDAEFTPGYPSGPNYDVFTATLPILGAISDSDGDGQLNDERCTDQYEAGLQIGLAVAAVANSIAQGACAIAGADPTGIATAIACAISTTTSNVQVAIEIAIAQCDFQSGAVDSAELQAAYENSRILVQALTCQTVASLSRGHGCDGADEDCDLVADECGEDVFAPALTITGNMAAGWFASAADAAGAVNGATSAVDDCRTVTVQPAVITGACATASATVTATDACGNQSSTSAPVRIDGQPPTLAIGGSIPGSCHTSIAAAELATLASLTVADNCSTFGPGDVQLLSTVTDCSLRIRAKVTDGAGLSAESAATVRVDTALPRVEIERLLLGTHLPLCFASAGAAEAAVFTASRFGDNCTATESLAKSVSSSGDLCGLQVTSHAVDECSNANTDTVTVRVDAVVPTVSCTVETSTLGTDHTMVDVGFEYEAEDNCLELSVLSVVVTSDEATTAKSSGGQTHSPDAELLRDGSGQVTGIRLRSERAGSGDGRVYAIRVTATDRCHNTQSATCTVSVPPNGNGQAVDSGQLYDAATVN